MYAYTDKLTDVAMCLVLALLYLSYRYSWRDSSLKLMLAAALVPAIAGQVLLLGIGSSSPFFLFVYVAISFALLVWGGIERHQEWVNV